MWKYIDFSEKDLVKLKLTLPDDKSLVISESRYIRIRKCDKLYLPVRDLNCSELKYVCASEIDRGSYSNIVNIVKIVNSRYFYIVPLGVFNHSVIDIMSKDIMSRGDFYDYLYGKTYVCLHKDEIISGFVYKGKLVETRGFDFPIALSHDGRSVILYKNIYTQNRTRLGLFKDGKFVRRELLNFSFDCNSSVSLLNKDSVAISMLNEMNTI